MKKVFLTEAIARLPWLIVESKVEPVAIVNRHGERLAVLKSYDQYLSDESVMELSGDPDFRELDPEEMQDKILKFCRKSG